MNTPTTNPVIVEAHLVQGPLDESWTGFPTRQEAEAYAEKYKMRLGFQHEFDRDETGNEVLLYKSKSHPLNFNAEHGAEDLMTFITSLGDIEDGEQLLSFHQAAEDEANGHGELACWFGETRTENGQPVVAIID